MHNKFIFYSELSLAPNTEFTPWWPHGLWTATHSGTGSKTRVKFGINFQSWKIRFKHSTLKLRVDQQDLHWRRFAASVEGRVNSCREPPQPRADVCEAAFSHLHPKGKTCMGSFYSLTRSVLKFHSLTFFPLFLSCFLIYNYCFMTALKKKKTIYAPVHIEKHFQKNASSSKCIIHFSINISLTCIFPTNKVFPSVFL